MNHLISNLIYIDCNLNSRLPFELNRIGDVKLKRIENNASAEFIENLDKRRNVLYVDINLCENNKSAQLRCKVIFDYHQLNGCLKKNKKFDIELIQFSRARQFNNG